MSQERLDILIRDAGVRDGDRIQAEFHGVASKMSRVDGRMLVIQPVATNIFTHENAAQFAIDARDTDVALAAMKQSAPL